MVNEETSALKNIWVIKLPFCVKSHERLLYTKPTVRLPSQTIHVKEPSICLEGQRTKNCEKGSLKQMK